ncbi:uncharacterized protein LOC129340931 [Eublepharis macularius]|uniref:Uncharacterized protein LOC129340931 n=1 Tax=Eublepharis macularius TaxID=481883 RepID=A0AA97KAY3_EUBMA|nr:uncharacterized protein LOC129340931 [Eublepharis macularius]
MTDILSRLSALEGTSEGPAIPLAAVDTHAIEEDVVGTAAGEIVANWPAEAGQLALVVQPPEAEGAVGRQERVRILICGHSMIFWAAHQARRSWIGSQLGLSRWATIEWQGRRGLRWAGLLPLLFEGRSAPPPHILVVHLGGNDLGLMKGVALSWQARDDFLEIRKRWPGYSTLKVHVCFLGPDYTFDISTVSSQVHAITISTMDRSEGSIVDSVHITHIL